MVKEHENRTKTKQSGILCGKREQKRAKKEKRAEKDHNYSINVDFANS